MDKSDLEGLAAVVNFNCSVLQILCLILVVAKIFAIENEPYFLRLIKVVLEPVFFPFRKILGIFTKRLDFLPLVVIFVSIPLQFILVHEIRTL